MDNWSWSDQGGEKKGVAPPPACENSSVVERCLAKAEVEGSTPFFRPPRKSCPADAGHAKDFSSLCLPLGDPTPPRRFSEACGVYSIFSIHSTRFTFFSGLISLIA